MQISRVKMRSYLDYSYLNERIPEEQFSKYLTFQFDIQKALGELERDEVNLDGYKN